MGGQMFISAALDCVSNVELSCRILGFRRAPLVVGRYINLRTEIKPVATEQLLSTFLMHGQCLICLSSSVCLSDLPVQETPHRMVFGEGVAV